MGKTAKKNEVRAPAANTTSKKIKQKFIKKKTTKVQVRAVEDTVQKGLQGVSIFEQLNDANQRGQQRSLMALAAVSLTPDMPHQMFYEPRSIARVLELANQLQHQVNLMALDAIRNLYIQANLIDQPQYAQLIIDQGLFVTLEQIIGKAIAQLQFDQEHPAENTRSRQSKAEEYQLVIEQAFICLSDVCHFVEHGAILQQLTASPLVTKSIQLIKNCMSLADTLNVRIFKQVSIFLRELSNDNEYVKTLDLNDIASLVENMDSADSALSGFQLTVENIDFYWNLVELHFNVIAQKEGSIGVFSRLPLFLAKLRSLFDVADSDPVTYFRQHFLAKYKLSDQSNEAKSLLTISEEEAKRASAAQDEASDGEEIMQEAEDEDQVAKNEPLYRRWYANLLAQNNGMRIVLKLADYLDTSKVDGADDSDEDFEDCEEMDDGETESQAQVIDLDSQKEECLQAVASFFDHVLLRTQTLPQIIGLQRSTGDALDELQETSFAVLTSLLFSELPQVKQSLGPHEGDILQAVMNFIKLSAYKSERPSCENAAECLSALTCFSESARKTIYANDSLLQAAHFAVYLPTTVTMTKMYMIQTFSKVFSTSQGSVPEVLLCQSAPVMSEITQLLMDSCQSGDLVLISAALDAFFDIFSEENYNQLLIDNNMIQMMAQGAPGLQQLYLRAKQEKLLNRNELANVENALENLLPFVEYKKGVMNLTF